MGSDNDKVFTTSILVVDDEPSFLEQTTECLGKSGYTVLQARNGKDALAIADSQEVDLILLDIIMPVLNGVEVTKILKRNPQTRDIPIIVISTMTEYKDRVEFFRIGANDYMPKPIDSGELLARVELQLQVVRLRKEVERANQTLTQKNQMLEQHVARIEKDLAIARSVQRALMPPLEESFTSHSVHLLHMSSENLGSDFIDYLQDDAGTFHLIIADVSGHGIASALLASQLKVLFMTLSKQGLAPGQLMNQINKLAISFLTEGYYFTAIYCQYRASDEYMTIVNAGHQPLLLLERSTDRVKQVESVNAPLGFFESEDYKEVRLAVGPGDLALVFTDGLAEHTNSANEMFELENVIRVLKQGSQSTTGEIPALLVKQAREFGASPVFSDDVTIGLLSFRGEEGTPQAAAAS